MNGIRPLKPVKQSYFGAWRGLAAIGVLGSQNCCLDGTMERRGTGLYASLMPAQFTPSVLPWRGS